MRWSVLLAALFGSVPAAALAASAIAPAAAAAAAAGIANEYRGGWETYGPSVGSHIYEFSIRGARVRGVYCSACSDATTLAFVDGRLGAHGMTFVVTHVREDGRTAYVDHATATFERGLLRVTGSSGAPGGGRFQWLMRKDPRGPAPVAGTAVNQLRPGAPGAARPPVRAAISPARARFAPPPYVQPGPWEQLTPARVVGVWIGFGAGINKQFFIIRRVGHELRGMVCGRCDNPYTMAALDDFRIHGDTLRFSILHEDWGPGSLPAENEVTAHIARNEMRISTHLNNTTRQVPGFDVHASLFGPIAIEATRGN